MVGEKGTRSNRMDSELLDAIGDGLRARQILLPRHSDPRLDPNQLPEVQLDEAFIQHILSNSNVPLAQRLRDGTPNNASKLLSTPMRDARNSGPALRRAHKKAGEYLATHFLADMFETEEYPIQHVQDRPTSGHRLQGEYKIVIAALMRGGEPMAFGVNEIFPHAMFIHPFEPTDIAPKHLLGRHAICLVDSVINSGKSVVEFVQHIRWINADIRIVVVAGVVQEKALSQGRLARLLSVDPHLHLVFLRKSENKFVGRGGTDTGNRLFNTTEFD
jgi:uracil phosphoribosyltransferase